MGSIKSMPPVHEWEVSSSISLSSSLAIVKQRPNRFLRALLAAAVWLGLVLVALAYLRSRRTLVVLEKPGSEGEFWESFPPFDGFYLGRKTIVQPENLQSEQDIHGLNHSEPAGTPSSTRLLPFRPYPRDSSRQPCFLDTAESISAPSIYAYPGVPQHMTAPTLGSHELLGLDSGVCYDRYGRYGPYGLGYDEDKGGLSQHGGDQEDSDVVWSDGQIDYRRVSWAHAQTMCHEKNNARLRELPRTAFVLRTWHDMHYTPHMILMLRAMINELSLLSGGEYTVHFLIHVQDTEIPIWADEATYNETLRNSLPLEFQGMGSLWSEPQMELIYNANAFESRPSFENMSGGKLFTAYRNLHLPLQYWSSQNPDFDFVWSWEMDIRLTGHYYEFLDRAVEWARSQPRDLLWERNSRFYIPSLHGSWESFCAQVVDEVNSDPSTSPVAGPLPPAEPNTHLSPNDFDTSWPSDGEADLITFNPIFDPNNTAWMFNSDATGYSLNHTKPPRRTSIITATRFSRRLLSLMHAETYELHHTMFPEMYPASIALHYGLKAVFVPMPVYFDRYWTPEILGKRLNSGKAGSTGGDSEGPFGPREHVFRGSSWYSSANFAGALWRRWLGREENGAGGPDWEIGGEGAYGKHAGTGRMCLRSTLIHPVKFE